MIPEIVATARFTDRLELAIVHWTERQQNRIRTTLAQPPEGSKGLLSSALGMASPSQLSDILSGRTQGLRYRDTLAELLEVERAWLEGDDEVAPDWALPPLDAWERFALRLDLAWDNCRAQKTMTSEDSGTMQIDLVADESRLARLLKLPYGDANLALLAGRRWAEVPDALLLLLQDALGLSPVTHPEHLALGRCLALAVQARVQRAVATISKRYQRFFLPPHLFKLARLGLAGLKGQRIHHSKGHQPIDDCLELLWRQALMARGESRPLMPEPAMRETGRSSWTSLDRLQARYSHTEDILDVVS